MIRIFIAYSSKDLVFKDEIRKRLRPMERAGKVDVWDNYNIEVGKDWDAEVREKLGQSDIILLLLSPDALDSDYFYDVEAPIALRRHEAGEAIAVGILLRPCDLKYTPFGDMTRYELLPKKGLPITDRHWRIFDEAYLTIFQEVDILIEKIETLRNGGKTELEHLKKDKPVKEATYNKLLEDETSLAPKKAERKDQDKEGEKTLNLEKLLPWPIGIEISGGEFHIIIEASTTIPVKRTMTFSTATDNQPQVEIHVLRGVNRLAKDNQSLGRFIFDGIMPAPRGVPQIEVTLEVDKTGILSISSKDIGMGKEQNVRINSSGKHIDNSDPKKARVFIF